MRISDQKTAQHGFTLVEMAMVLIILGFVLSMVLLPLQAQRDVNAQRQTEAILADAKSALIGFAQTHGRLPCPASQHGSAAFPDDTGHENPNAGGVCVVQVGFLPASTLGLQQVDAQGYALDAWQNRIRYAVTRANADAFTKTNGMQTIGLSALAPDLRVCATANNCTGQLQRIGHAAAVVFSLGATANQGVGGIDEAQNLIAPTNTQFVSHTATTATSANGEFDHIVRWLSPYVLYNAMIAAGQLH